ncbi:radical SAM protein [Candidatus Woesearchaeota archaeon]|nr:radical SAM protein [Candidatus Woesearchaeota archaeon]
MTDLSIPTITTIDTDKTTEKDFFQRFEGFKLGFPLKQPYCNTNCSHCYLGRKEGNVSEEEYTRRKKVIDNIISLSARLETRHISIVGSEPTLESELISLTDRMMGEMLMVTMSTNGWFTGSNVPFEIPSGKYEDGSALLDSIIYDYFTFGLMVSIDGIGEVHDIFRNMNGLYERAIRTLDYAKSLCVKLPTGVEVVIHHDNYMQLQEIVEEVIKHDIQFIKMVPVLNIGSGKDIKPFNEHERAQIQETLLELALPLFSSGVKPDFANFEKDFPTFSIDNLSYCSVPLAPKHIYQRNIPFDLSHCGYPLMPGIGNPLEKSVEEIIASLPESWSYKLHSELRDKGIEEVGRIVTDPDLRSRHSNLMCGPCLIMVNVYKAYHETGDLEYANRAVKQMFIG